MRRKIFIVFDKLPPLDSGGLVEMYARFVSTFSKEYDIKIISVFNFDYNDVPEFQDIDIIKLCNIVIDNRFYHAINHLKKLHFRKFFISIFSAALYFMYAPISRIRMKKLIDNDIVIASAPAGAYFISKNVDFLLDIHSQFEYFWGSNKMGRLQSKIMRKPVVTVFRNQADCKKGNELFTSEYVYNFYDDSNMKHDVALTDRRNICFVGRMHPAKDPLRMVNIVHTIKQKGIDVIVDVYGTGILEDRVKEEVKKLQLQDNIKFKGFVKEKAFYDTYRLLWVTSKAEAKVESFNLVTVEAKAAGVPCVSTCWGPATYEVIEQGVDGYVALNNDDFIEKTIALLNDDELFYHFSKCARHNYETRFSKEQYKEKYEFIFKKYFS